MGKSFLRIRETKPPVSKESEQSEQVRRTHTEENKEVNISDNMRKILGDDSFRVTAPTYTTVEHGNIQVSYAQIEKDYYYQVEFKKKPAMNEKDVLASIMFACSTIVPNHIDVYISPPPKDIDWEVYTIIVKDSVKLLNAKQFLESKLVNKFLELPLWPKFTSLRPVR